MDPNFYYYLSPAGRASSGAEPVILLPSSGDYEPAYPGDDIASEPVIPLPSPGDYGPAYPGDSAGEFYPPAPIITWPPSRPEVPTCSGNSGGNQTGTAQVRFLNAAYNYPALRVTVDNNLFANRLNYAAVTGYGQVRPGYRTVTVSNTNGRVYLQKSLPFQTGGRTTAAVINTGRGLDLLQINDSCCSPPNGWSNLRIGNLADNSGLVDVILSDGRVVFSDLRFKEVSAFKRIAPGTYRFFYADTNLSAMSPTLAIENLDPAWLGVYPPQETFGSLLLNVDAGESYTVYLLQKGAGLNNIQNLILVDR